MTKIAITGGSGKLGRHIVNHLLKKIFCIFSRSELFKKKTKLQMVKIDITDEDQYPNSLNKLRILIF